MKKQIIYVGFVPRLLAMTFDLALTSILFSPLMRLISKNLFFLFFQINLPASQEYNDYFAQNLWNHIEISDFILYIIVIFLINIILTGIYYVAFWQHFGATIGKMIMRIKILDEATLQLPSAKQAIIRFVGYAAGAFSILPIIFNTKHQGAHDKWAKTIVIKA
jgi:uncharacterized RDD family membrane protein YckC